MRVLMISKANVTRSYRTKLWYLNREPDLTVGLVVPSAWGTLPFEPMPEDETFPLWVRPIRLNGRNHFHYYPGLSGVVDQFQPDLVHIDEEHYSFVTYQAVSIVSRRRIPALFFTWQNLYKDYPWPFSSIERRVLGYVSAAIAGNAEAVEVLQKKGFRKPVAIIPQFGTDDRLFVPDPGRGMRKELGLSDTIAIGYVGRLIPEKGLDDLVDAALPLLHKDERIRLVFAGSGPWREAGEAKLRAEGVQTQAVFVPWVPSADMPRLMNALDVLVLPSRTTARWKEQFGRVLTEAMAVGVPVVGSSSGEIPSVIGDAGMVFPEGDKAALGKILSDLVHDPAGREDLARRGHERVRDRFTQEAVARATAECYRRIQSSH